MGFHGTAVILCISNENAAAVNVVVVFFIFRKQYTNYGEVNDFYKVESMRGTYLTSRMNSGKYALQSYVLGGEGVPLRMVYIGMCRFERYSFQAVYSGLGFINQRVWV